LSVHQAIFSNATGAASGGTLTTGCATQFTVPILSCTISVAPKTVEGLSLQNVDAAGAATAAATPAGTKLLLVAPGFTYTSTGACPALEHGSMTIVGSVAVSNLYAKL
jgi:hypothetical protein